MPHDFDKADTLIYSDDPEALSAVMRPSPVHVTTPTNAIIYETEVGGGRKRVFYYHQNFDPTVRFIGVRVVNLAARGVKLRVIAYIEPPAGNVVGVGHRSAVGFLRALIAQSWSAVNLQGQAQPGHDAVLAVCKARKGQLASAFVEIDAPPASRLKIQVISAESEAMLKTVGMNGPVPGSGDGIGRSGVFDLTRGGTTHGDFAELTWDVNGKRLEITVPDDATFPNAKVARVSPGRIPAEAVFGVFTRRTVEFSNTGAADVTIGIYAQACGGDSPGTCMVDNEIIELGTMKSGEHDARPGYEMATRTIRANAKRRTTVDLLGTVDPSGKGPLSIILAKRGTVPRPDIAKQVVFLPGGGPWRA